MIFEYFTSPMSNQREYIEQHAHDAAHALWWEMGTGKSKAVIDNAAALYCDGAIDALFLVAPNGLHRNFITKECTKHLLPSVNPRIMYWQTDKGSTHYHQQAARDVLSYRDGLAVLAMSYDGIMTQPGRILAGQFLTQRRALYVLDESPRIKEPTAARTKRVLKSGNFSAYKRILTGTPISNAPWDVWSQIKFLDDGFWKPHGLDSIESMKAAFGQWGENVKRVPFAMIKRGKSLQAYYKQNHIPECVQTTFTNDEGICLQHIPTLVRDPAGRPQYKDLDRLRSIISPIRSRVLKADVMDLPPKVPHQLEFDLSPAQRAAYDTMRQLGIAIIEDQQCTARLALTVLLRLQQIACGYIIIDTDADDPLTAEVRVQPITPNPRLDLMLELTQDMSHQALIWARFRQDINAIVAALAKQGKTVGRYDGGVTDEECAANEDAFHRGDIQFLALTQGKGGEGLTLIEAHSAIYYSNTFRLIDRLQSSDRPHRYGLTHSVEEIDLIARHTVDEKILANLQAKIDMASTVTGDNLRAYLDD